MDKSQYLSKRLLSRAITPAIRKASQRAMQQMGFVVKAENGWIVRVAEDGTTEKLSRIDSDVKGNHRIQLD